MLTKFKNIHIIRLLFLLFLFGTLTIDCIGQIEDPLAGFKKEKNSKSKNETQNVSNFIDQGGSFIVAVYIDPDSGIVQTKMTPFDKDSENINNKINTNNLSSGMYLVPSGLSSNDFYTAAILVKNGSRGWKLRMLNGEEDSSGKKSSSRRSRRGSSDKDDSKKEKKPDKEKESDSGKKKSSRREKRGL